jgi:hypothetical protein
MIGRGNGAWISIGWLLTGVAIGIAATSVMTLGPGRTQFARARGKALELSSGEPANRARLAAARMRATASDLNLPVRLWLERGVRMVGRRNGSAGTDSSLELTAPAGNGVSSGHETARRRRRAAEPAEA